MQQVLASLSNRVRDLVGAHQFPVCLEHAGVEASVRKADAPRAIFKLVHEALARSIVLLGVFDCAASGGGGGGSGASTVLRGHPIPPERHLALSDHVLELQVAPRQPLATIFVRGCQPSLLATRRLLQRLGRVARQRDDAHMRPPSILRLSHLVQLDPRLRRHSEELSRGLREALAQDQVVVANDHPIIPPHELGVHRDFNLGRHPDHLEHHLALHGEIIREFARVDRAQKVEGDRRLAEQVVLLRPGGIIAVKDPDQQFAADELGERALELEVLIPHGVERFGLDRAREFRLRLAFHDLVWIHQFDHRVRVAFAIHIHPDEPHRPAQAQLQRALGIHALLEGCRGRSELIVRARQAGGLFGVRGGDLERHHRLHS